MVEVSLVGPRPEKNPGFVLVVVVVVVNILFQTKKTCRKRDGGWRGRTDRWLCGRHMGLGGSAGNKKVL